jgi:hypothetical protein
MNPAVVANMAKLLIGGTAAAWGFSNSLFNVEGGHRAIVFNRLAGIKEEVGLPVVHACGWCGLGCALLRCWVAALLAGGSVLASGAQLRAAAQHRSGVSNQLIVGTHALGCP